MRVESKWIIALWLAVSSSAVWAFAALPAGLDVRAGLELHAESGQTEQALLRHTAVEFDISGLLVSTKVKQTFHNEQNGWTEGVYTFPLPEGAAVNRLLMRVGERTIEGQVKEREAARKTYTQAKQNGQRASIVEQQRPNMFTTSIANIGPGETVIVEIEYQQLAGFDSGQFRLRFPLTILPRYIPGTPVQADDSAGRHGDFIPAPRALSVDDNLFGWGVATDEVADAALITPPVAGPNEHLHHRVSIRANLNAGFRLAHVESSYHPVTVIYPNASEAAVTLADDGLNLDRDFELVWMPVVTEKPQAALLGYEQGGNYYGTLMILPPSPAAPAAPLPKSVTLVLDISGSMHGTSIEQAKLSLRRAINSLRAQDRFNLVVFNNRTQSMFNAPQPASDFNRQRALTFLNSLDAEGGTEMVDAIRQALGQPVQHGYVEQVLFVTDGAVGNEAALFKLIQTQLGNQRLYTVGIGSAPNSHFMSKAAQLGRGTFTYIGNTHEVQQRMDALLAKLDAPQLTAIEIDSPEPLEYFPARLPDLYQGEPLLVNFRAASRPTQLTVRGRSTSVTNQQQQWQEQLRVGDDGRQPAIALVWARAKIAELMDQYRSEDDDGQRTEIRKQVVATALEHHLVSRFTSLVAVDVTPVRPDGEPITRSITKNLLPEGSRHQKIFGLAKTATSAPLQIAMGSLLLLASIVAYWRRRSLSGSYQSIKTLTHHA